MTLLTAGMNTDIYCLAKQSLKPSCWSFDQYIRVEIQCNQCKESTTRSEALFCQAVVPVLIPAVRRVIKVGPWFWIYSVRGNLLLRDIQFPECRAHGGRGTGRTAKTCGNCGKFVWKWLLSDVTSQGRAEDSATYIVFCGPLYRTNGTSGTSVVYTWSWTYWD